MTRRREQGYHPRYEVHVHLHNEHPHDDRLIVLRDAMHVKAGQSGNLVIQFESGERRVFLRDTWVEVTFIRREVKVS